MFIFKFIYLYLINNNIHNSYISLQYRQFTSYIFFYNIDSLRVIYIYGLKLVILCRT